MKNLLTSQEYVDKSGVFCPVCGCSEISAAHPEIEDSGIYVNVECICGAIWVDFYELKGYDNLIEGADEIDFTDPSVPHEPHCIKHNNNACECTCRKADKSS